ncbi:hypothetical protein BH24ACT5_BH24ACT5_21290 [soil metagenome]
MVKVAVSAGFDGSDVDDHTVIRLETIDGWVFTPQYGPDDRPTAWNPAEWPNHRIPRGEVHVAMSELFERYDVERVYCDPRDWQTDIETWALTYGADHVIEWDTGRISVMHLALERFVTDLATGVLTHDGCPITAQHVANARKVAKPGDRYILAKPNQHQKIDAAMATVLAHEAASDARAAGWGVEEDRRVFFFS